MGGGGGQEAESLTFIYSQDKAFGVVGKGGMILVLVVFR